ncbi:UDP-N-acetylmuramoyl-tripeptide--D-alanyl-D-alanine ligase [Aureibaculum sp. 2210JD6-5]|uniref:UDP-N-acetylmuramoyl-tripeptide--D-alanyl-D- alanine ligase n=1 Tax=Aureibaculum sp. 2210JD6-5 TaxID=3103957 RepID=UPI002AAE6C86|nr:UDP-N-acetylmuramoyl-tripeptide--D-alanyl-D-alanine ligase [Aureibaculum sp. 2210JD6-5]MDY7395408.1 UDP-N-acetylmuramoyl-tripeptide--D-alanyl-D-alanine ligase [Aureibaculum sp. 2210JD6-5]
MNISELYKLYKQTYRVSTDTRKIEKDCLFFALKGDNFNGNKFAKDAIKKGASYAIIDEAIYQTNNNCILVNDVLETLQKLATFHRKELNIPIIGLTGSNGKTTTKELINAVLSKKYKTTATRGNLNNHIGVPLTLLSMTPETEIGIVEMGANHLKEIEFLSNICQPDYGYITNFGKAHLEGFGSIEGVIEGKSELYNYLENNNKIAFVNANDQLQLEKTEKIDRITFGGKNSNITINFVEAKPFVHLKFNNTIVKSQLIGAYNYNNIAAALAIGSYFKIKDEDSRDAIKNYAPSNNRSQIILQNSNKIILDAYNANPSSMQVALENLSGLTDNSKIAILGDMFELGETTKYEHQNIIDTIAKLSIDKAYLIGENFYKCSSLNKNIMLFKSFEDFKEHFSNLKISNSTLLIKASRSMALERVLELL